MTAKFNRSYKDLRVWHKAMELAGQVYDATGSMPKEEMYGLTAQIRKSAVSIPSNIAEGCARNGRKEFIQFLGIASGSLAELHTQLLLAVGIGYISPGTFDILLQYIDDIGRMLNGLKSSIKSPGLTPTTSNEQQATNNV